MQINVSSNTYYINRIIGNNFCKNSVDCNQINFKSKAINKEVTIMTNAIAIKKYLSSFTQKGQKMAMKILKENRKNLKSNNYIVTLFKKLKKNGTIAKLEKESVFYSINQLAMNLLNAQGFSNDEVNLYNNYLDQNYKKFRAKFAVQMCPDDILTKKDEIISLLKGFPYHSKEIQTNINKLQKVRTKEDMIIIFNNIRNALNLTDKIEELNKSEVKFSKLKKYKLAQSFELQQEYYNYRETLGNLLFKIYKIITPQSTNPEIIKIEDLLKTKYGMEYVHFSTLNEAKNFLKALKIFQKKGPIPKAVISAPFYYNAAAENLQITEGHLIIITPHELAIKARDTIDNTVSNKNLYKYIKNYCKLKNFDFKSTDHPCHDYVHEMEHSNKTGYGHLCLIGMKIDKYKKCTVNKISGYAQSSDSPEEWRTELQTKLILGENLTTDEKELLEYIEAQTI